LKQALQQLIAQGKTEQVIDQLLQLTERSGDTELREEVLLQASRYRDYAKAKRMGTSGTEDQQITLAPINQALIQIIQQLSEEGEEKGSSIAPAERTKGKTWQYVVGVGVVIGILSGIAGITGFNLKSLFGLGTAESPLQLTVYVHGPDGKQDIVLENEGQLLLDLRNDRRPAQIGEHGRTNFGEISRDFVGKEIPLSVQAEDYEMAYPDSGYVYDGEPIYLEVRRDKQLGIIQGKVRSRDGSQFLSDVSIEVEGEVTHSDSTGNFYMELPEDKWQEEYTLYAQKDGYQIKEEKYYPKLGGMEIRLTPKSN